MRESSIMDGVSLRSFVFAVEFTVGDPARVWAVLKQHEENLRALGARYVFVYESIVESGNVLVVIGIRTEQPPPQLLRSPELFGWFDAVGLDDLPAVFVGERVDLFDIGDPPPPGSEIVVAAVTAVDNVENFMVRVSDSLSGFADAGIRRTLVYRALDTTHEVMFLQQLANEENALKWIERSHIAASWLASAGVGAYPPVFVGRFLNAMRLAGSGTPEGH